MKYKMIKNIKIYVVWNLKHIVKQVKSRWYSIYLQDN